MRDVLLAVLDVVPLLPMRTLAHEQCCLCYELTKFSPMLQEWHSSQLRMGSQLSDPITSLMDEVNILSSMRRFYLKVSAALPAQGLSLVLSFPDAPCDLHLPVPYCSFLGPHLF